MKYLIYTLVLSISFSIRAQEFEKDMKAVIEKMDASTSISISVKVALYNKKGGAIQYSTVSTVEHSGSTTITKLGEMEMFTSDKYEVQVDNEENQVFIHPVSKTNVDFSDINLKEIKKLLERDETVVKKPTYGLLSNVNGIKTYTIKNIDGYKEWVVVLDTKEEKIKKVEYEYEDVGTTKGQYCVLVYEKFDFSPSFSSTYFDYKNYFTLENKQYTLSKRFKTYKLIVQ